MDVEIKIQLPETLVREAKALGILSSERLEVLIRAEIHAQLNAMANDPQIQQEIRNIESEFIPTEADGLSDT